MREGEGKKKATLVMLVQGGKEKEGVTRGGVAAGPPCHGDEEPAQLGGDSMDPPSRSDRKGEKEKTVRGEGEKAARGRGE